jgi:adenylate cyclase
VLGPLSPERLKASGGKQALALALGAHFLLDGHFRKQGDRMRLSVRLVDVASHGTLWAETFDSGDQVSDLFAFEDAVTSHIAAVLGDTYGVIHHSLTPQALEKQPGSIQVYDAILRYYHFSAEFPAEARASTLRALESAVNMDPHNPVTLALLADMHLVEYQLGGDEEALARAEELICHALATDPNCQHAHYANAGLYFERGQRELLLEESNRVIMLNPNRPDLIAMCGQYLALAGKWEQGIAIMEEARHLSPYLPSTYRIGPFMNFYRQGRYQEALLEAKRIHAPEFVWDPLLRAAALGQLGQTEEAKAALRELLVLQPDFPVRSRELMRRTVFSEENVEMLLRGLRQVGFG